jgi:hypothetical protein
MGKNKIIYLMVIIVCSCRFHMNNGEVNSKILGDLYTYKNETSVLNIILELKNDYTFSFKQTSGFSVLYSEGLYKIENNNLILNTILPFEDDGLIKANQIQFSNEKIKIKKNKLEYRDYTLKRVVYR